MTMDEFPVPANKRKKLCGMEFYRDTLGSPKYVVAPMVDQSELAWRLLSRRHGAQLCYSPMFHSSIFAKDAKYRKEALQSCREDRPLIIQFCGNDPDVILEAALQAQDHCDAIDINLGCPQAIAKRGHYGSFLQDEWDLISAIVGLLHKKLAVPVTCKVRIFEDKQKTIDYAQMLERSGCQLLTVHGRTREQKGPLTGIADWSYIKLVKQNVSVPVFANGNIMCLEDVHRCLEETGANGVMTAEGNLYNPLLFEKRLPITWEVAHEYMDIVEKYPVPSSYIRGHLFKIFHHLFNLKDNFTERELVATGHSIEEFRQAVISVAAKYIPYHSGEKLFVDEKLPDDYNLLLPPWICQSYVRPPPEVHLQKLELHSKINENPDLQRKYYDRDGNPISRKLMKKMRRVERRPIKVEGKHERSMDGCGICGNPVGLKCEFKMCKKCCRDKCFYDVLDCPGHKTLIKTRREFRKNKNQQPISEDSDNVPEKMIKVG